MSHQPKSRVVGTTERSWCRSVTGGTGIAVLGLKMTKPPSAISTLQTVLVRLQNNHPILRSKLRYNAATKEFSFLFSATTDEPAIKIKSFDSSSTSELIKTLEEKENPKNPKNLSPFHLLLEHELKENKWLDPNSFPSDGVDLMFASLYTLSDEKCVVVLRLHMAICDKTTAVTLLRELMELAKEVENGGVVEKKIENDDEGKLGIEDMIPSGLAKKTFWVHGMDMLGYSVNSLRLTNLKFKNVKWPRNTEVVRLQMNTQDTDRILIGCKSRGIKLCGALSAAALIAAHSSKGNSDQTKKKYGVVTLTDCRSILEPPLTSHHFGFYHSAILNTLTVKGTENVWDLAKRSYNAFAEYKKSNKHFSDIADINFLMCKAIENPGLTASSSLRTSYISVFEDPVFDNSDKMQKELGVDDYMGCASIHGVGPSICMFDTIRDGELDCVCVYPSPLHSREQMTELVDNMKRVLIDASLKA